MRCVLSSCLLLLSVANVTAARDIHVDNIAGSDSQEGETRPYRSITRALRAAGKADRIIIENTGEPYRESITLQGGNHSGREGFAFTIVGNGAVIDGTKPVPADAWEHVRGHIFRFRPEFISYQQFYIDGLPATRRPVLHDGVLPKLEELEWCLFRGYIHFRTEKGRLPHEYESTYAAHRVGITLYDVQNVVIDGLVVQGFQLDGINAADSVFDATIVGAVCQGNGRSGIAVNGASRVRIEACLAGHNGEAQILTDGYSHTQIINCNLLENPAPGLLKKGGEVQIADGTR